ncbi:MAG: septation protein A, partial [Nitrosomonadales bacterium]|nr:septation protein A [Nitrosomonadales bacterium]
MQKFLFDLLPIILFFIAFKFCDIFTATAVAIIATLLQIVYVFLKNKTVEKV